MNIIRVIWIGFLLIGLLSCKMGNNNGLGDNDILILKHNDSTSMYAYYDKSGNKVLGDYRMAFTDTLKDYGIVADSGFILIDKTGKHLYNIFPYDNGPDYTSDGLYRIIDNGKIGYVDSATSTMVIPPMYECAWPFESGTAKVSDNCSKIQDGEHWTWESNDWYYIDKKGIRIE